MHYLTPNPFFRKSRKRCYVQLGGKQINLGPARTSTPDKNIGPNNEEAFRQCYQLMADSAAGSGRPEDR